MLDYVFFALAQLFALQGRTLFSSAVIHDIKMPITLAKYGLELQKLALGARFQPQRNTKLSPRLLSSGSQALARRHPSLNSSNSYSVYMHRASARAPRVGGLVRHLRSGGLARVAPSATHRTISQLTDRAGAAAAPAREEGQWRVGEGKVPRGNKTTGTPARKNVRFNEACKLSSDTLGLWLLDS